MANTFSWKFPQKDFLLMRIETFFVSLLALLVFIVSFFQFNKSLSLAVLFTIIFLGLYALLSYLIQRLRAVEENYKLTDKHLQVVRKKGSKIKKEKALLKDIVHHKLDKFFLGGYLLTNKGNKHLLFFNTKEEVEKFEKLLKKYLKKK